MKYMILAYGSQQDYDAMAGKPTAKPAWSEQDFTHRCRRRPRSRSPYVPWAA